MRGEGSASGNYKIHVFLQNKHVVLLVNRVVISWFCTQVKGKIEKNHELWPFTDKDGSIGQNWSLDFDITCCEYIFLCNEFLKKIKASCKPYLFELIYMYIYCQLFTIPHPSQNLIIFKWIDNIDK